MSQPGIGKGNTVTDSGDSHCATCLISDRSCIQINVAATAVRPLIRRATCPNRQTQSMPASEAAQECQNDAATATIMVWMKGGTRHRFGFSTSTAALIMWLAGKPMLLVIHSCWTWGHALWCCALQRAMTCAVTHFQQMLIHARCEHVFSNRPEIASRKAPCMSEADDQ